MAGDDIKYTVGVNFTGEGELKRAAGQVDAMSRGVASGTGIATGAAHAFGTLAAGIGVAGAAFWAISNAAGAAYATLREGAQLETTIQRFDKLSASIGTTAGVMLSELRTATKGMIDDATLMSSASQIMSLGLANNEAQVVRLATVAGTLGWDMQQVILTFANLSTMRLDALGLSVTEVKDKAEELEAAGMSASEAFKEAVILAGEARLDVGGVSEAEQTYKQFEATITNSKNELKLMAAELATNIGLIGDLSESAQRSQLNRVIRQSREELQELGVINFWDRIVMGFEQTTMSVEELEATADAALAQVGNALLHNENAWAGWAMGVQMNAQLAAESAVTASTDIVRAMVAGSQLDWMGGGFGTPAAPTPLISTRQSAYYDQRRALREQNLAFVRHDPAFMEAGMTARIGMEYERAASSMRTYGGALSAVTEEEQKAAEARQRFIAAFNQELLGKPEDGLINAEGVVNVEAMNEALYRQVEAAGASAATLALLGIATGQFSEEQAEAALKAAILQEQINQIADAVVAGKITLEQALGQLGDAQANLNQADLITVAQGVTAIPEGERTVAVEADVSEANKAIGGVQTTLSLMTDAPYLTTLDADIAGLLTGTDDAKRAIDSVPSQLTVTINWAQAGVDVLGALRALGIVL